MTIEPRFKAEEVRLVAKALIDEAEERDNCDRILCRYCKHQRMAWDGDFSKYQHAMDCAFLVARDLLT